MTTITKLKNALESMQALQDPEGHIFHGFNPTKCTGECADIQKSITDLRSVIAEMEAGVPVAFVQAVWSDSSKATVCVANGKTISKDDVLFTHPQPKPEPSNPLESGGIKKAEPVQCLDCGSNNVGVPANYDSVVTSVVNQKMTAVVQETAVFARRWSLAYDGFGVQRDDENGVYVYIDDALEVLHRYAAAPQVKPLTDEQIGDIWVEHGCEGEDAYGFARAIEAAHGIGGGK